MLSDNSPLLVKKLSSASTKSYERSNIEEEEWERKERLMSWFEENNIKPGFP